MKKTGDLEESGTIYNNLGFYFFTKKDFQKALQQYKLSYGYAAQMANHFHLCEACTRMAEIYQKLGKQDSALKYAEKAEDFAREIGSRSDLKEIYLIRAEIRKKPGPCQ